MFQNTLDSKISYENSNFFVDDNNVPPSGNDIPSFGDQLSWPNENLCQYEDNFSNYDSNSYHFVPIYDEDQSTRYSSAHEKANDFNNISDSQSQDSPLSLEDNTYLKEVPKLKKNITKPPKVQNSQKRRRKDNYYRSVWNRFVKKTPTEEVRYKSVNEYEKYAKNQSNLGLCHFISLKRNKTYFQEEWMKKKSKSQVREYLDCLLKFVRNFTPDQCNKSIRMEEKDFKENPLDTMRQCLGYEKISELKDLLSEHDITF